MSAYWKTQFFTCRIDVWRYLRYVKDSQKRLPYSVCGLVAITKCLHIKYMIFYVIFN